MTIKTKRISKGYYKVICDESGLEVKVEKLGQEHGDNEGSWLCYSLNNSISGKLFPNKRQAVFEAVTKINDKKKQIKQLAQHSVATTVNLLGGNDK